MDVKEYFEPVDFKHMRGNVLALDLEMANSFQKAPSVICMIGVESYDARKKQCYGRIASIARRSEEKEIILWLLDQLSGLLEKHPDGKLLTFSGIDNDMRWLSDRLEPLGLGAPEDTPLHKLAHVDLKAEFFQRTQNSKISLKKLEEIFGIERTSTVSSRKVSYILTDVIKKNKGEAAIPERIFQYLREDVHNLLRIHERWQETSLEKYNLPDLEYHGYVRSMINTVGKFINGGGNRNGYRKESVALKAYHRALQQGMQESLKCETFENFQLPEFPDARISHPEYERIVKKHRFLESVQIVDSKTGAYRFKRELFKPKGALAVVRKEGKVLMIRRAEHLERAGGFWGLPGGEVEKGETPAECARRELKEEINLDSRVAGVLGSSTSFNGRYELIWVELEVEDYSGLRPNTKEVGEVRWVAPRELGGLDPLIPGAVEGFERFLGKAWAQS
jgi:8-oxo-dGTP diphosphatase